MRGERNGGSCNGAAPRESDRERRRTFLCLGISIPERDEKANLDGASI